MSRQVDKAVPSVAVVIPAYLAERTIQETVRGFTGLSTWLIVVDDGSSDQTSRNVAESGSDVLLLRHENNRGVGAAMKTGIQCALEKNADLIVKVDADGQMDPAYLPALLKPLVRNQADIAKGNRWHHQEELLQMPRLRRLGNLFLGFLTRFASGHWNIFDPNNGYVAWRADLLRLVDLERIPDGFTFETSMLVETGILGATVQDVPIPARYSTTQESHLSVSRAPFQFSLFLLRALCRRIWARYFVFDFNVGSLFLVSGLIFSFLGASFGVYEWFESYRTGVPATAGTVLLAALPVLIGVNFLIQFLVLDVGFFRKEKISPDLRFRPRASSGPSGSGGAH